MDTGGNNNPKLGSDSQDSDDFSQPGTSKLERPLIKFSTKTTTLPKNVQLTTKGVEQAKKRLRAFSIQKKSSLSPVLVSKPISTGSATVFIGKATGVKPTHKPEPDPALETKKPPKPPKPGTKQPQESYIFSQKKTLAEIEDMKRKMELVELGIPLGLICPPPNSDKAMPTKAMPPIKTFIDSAKVDELIREAKKARSEGKEFKFDYRKLLPDYDNPFQRNKTINVPEVKELAEVIGHDEHDHKKSRDKEKKNYKRHFSHKSDKDRNREGKYKDKPSEKDNKDRDKSKETDSRNKNRDSKYKNKDEKSRDRDIKCKERDIKSKEKDNKKEEVKPKDTKETDVDLNDFVVCDSWSDNEDKSKDSTPKLDEIKRKIEDQVNEIAPFHVDPMEQLRETLIKQEAPVDSPKIKLGPLNPVIDSFKYEIDPDEDDIIDMFDENAGLEKYSSIKNEQTSPDNQIFDYDDAKADTLHGMADDTFLESVINEIKQEEMDETSQDKGLVEYDESPPKDVEARGSVTPEMNDRARQLYSSRSDYSDGYKSTESGYKSTESLKVSDYKSDTELERIVEARKKELERMVVERKLDKYTADSLETWSFVLKICQPLLFRHDRNKCYKETRVAPKLWYTENPKICNCVKDRRVVYEELEMCKMELVDTLYAKTQENSAAAASLRGWYPRLQHWAADSAALQASSEWEADDSQTGPATPEPCGELSLDKEYQKFMEAVWPDVAESKSETPRSTPVRREKKKADDEPEADRKAKKMKMSSEGWSQESDVEEEVNKSAVKKAKPEKVKRKRKHSTSTSVTDSSESDAKKRKKMLKKKDNKKSKSKDTKRRHVSKKNVKKIKAKPKKKKKVIEMEEDSDLQEFEKAKKRKEKKIRKKKQTKAKKKIQKKKKARARSSSSSSSTDSEAEQQRRSKKKKKIEKKKKHKKSFEPQEELFDVNILKNIKTERETDDELSKQLEFSPRRQKPREIINVKELQNDFVGNSIQIKKEVEHDEQKHVEDDRESTEVSQEKQKEESQESHAESIGEKEPQPNFKDQEDSQSTPQLPPEESNHSQASSQESAYSIKDQPVYEKDESHLRPSSQNSNYSFHDVMASGMYSKKIEKRIQNEHEMSSRDHEISSRDHEMSSRDHEISSRDHGMSSRDHGMSSRDHVISTREHEMSSREPEMSHLGQEISNSGQEMSIHRVDMSSHEHSMERLKHNIQRQEHIPRLEEHHKHDVHRHEHDIIHEHSIQRHENVVPMHEEAIPRLENVVPRHENVIPRHENMIQSHENMIQRHETDIQSHEHVITGHEHDIENHEYEQGNYEIYEQMAMAYQSDVASQEASPPDGAGERRIETVVGARACGEIKCDWRAGQGPRPAAPLAPARPSRWGLKPGDVNIVLTCGAAEAPYQACAPVYRIQSLANRTEHSATGYDEAYMDMYGAADRLQYGDCFSTEARAAEARGSEARGAEPRGAEARGTESRGAEPREVQRTPAPRRTTSLDARINLALRTSVLGEVAKDLEEPEEKDVPDKGILVMKSLSVGEGRPSKRVSFADGYKPGQDSDVEEPPVRKKKKGRRLGCAWPCGAEHPDHVALWDALPPPPPPAGSPPPTAPAAPPAHLLRRPRPPRALCAPHPAGKFDPSILPPAFMPPEPPPGMISFQNM